MKKITILSVCCILILTIFLMGCTGKNIAYKLCPLNPIENIDYNRLGVQFGNLFNSREELIKFYDNIIFDGIDKQSELDKYDDDYFENKSLIAVIFANDKNSNCKVKSLSRKGDQLWITIQDTGMKEFNELARFFIEVNKEDVLGIKEINYKFLTVK